MVRANAEDMGGISLSQQEDDARATYEEQKADEQRAYDYWRYGVEIQAYYRQLRGEHPNDTPAYCWGALIAYVGDCLRWEHTNQGAWFADATREYAETHGWDMAIRAVAREVDGVK